MGVEVIGASLKTRPTDFFVSENSLAELVDEHHATHHYILLRKCGFTTMEAIALIAKAADVPPTTISYAGLKDEDAVTEQLVALPIRDKLDPALVSREASKFNGPDRWIYLAHYGYGSKPLQIGYLAGNTFRVLMRMLSRSAAEALKLERSINLVFLNYYDLQRFGVPGQPKVTHRIGEAILSQHWDRALNLVVESRSPESSAAAAWTDVPEEFFNSLDPRLISFYLASASSHLWNNELCDLVCQFGKHSVSNSTTDGLRFSLLPSSQYVLKLMSRHSSVPYTRFSFAGGQWVRQNSVRPTSIQAMVQVGSIKEDDLNPGRYVASLGFMLPPGCYGTMALRQLAHFLVRGEVGLGQDPLKELVEA
jgi:tRNA pseudouridine13 synthase